MGSSIPPIEIGSLTALSPNESQFIGSSSGIFFVNTVRRAFAASKAGLPHEDPNSAAAGASTETYIGGVDSDDNQLENEDPSVNNQPIPSHFENDSSDEASLGRPPSREHASKLIQAYFRAWHPIFPFIHGPSFLREAEDYYSDTRPAQDRAERRRRHCRAITLQCIFNVAALDRPDLRLPPECTIKSSTVLRTQLFSLASRHNIPVLQALLAGQLYLIATMSLHTASTVGGILMRLIFHGGFHRCPCRYSQLSAHDSDMRKRIFWSTYAIDRYLSQALGLPLGIQDSDIDVCIPGADELHRPVLQNQGSITKPATTDVSLHLPEGHQNLTQDPSAASLVSSEISPRPATASDPPHHKGRGSFNDKRPGEEALAQYVSYGRLTGRALEMLHKSINVRTVQYTSVLELTSDIHSFWNSLPQQLQDLPTPKDNNGDDNTIGRHLLGLFFTIIYHQSILLVNRPFLSLETSSLEFRLSLQTCIGSSRTVISTLKGHAPGGRCISWPGTLSVTWMSGLIVAFACTLDLYPVKKGFPEIKTCLELLEEMSGKSATAKHCHSALKALLDDLSSSHYSEGLSNFATVMQTSCRGTYPIGTQLLPVEGQARTSVDSHISKRQRTSSTSAEQSLGFQAQNGESGAGAEATNRYASEGDSINNSAPLWFDQPGSDFNNIDPAAAYAQDILGSLSCETLVQYDESLENDFWMGDSFPGS
ncbi:hypothetical protein IFR05_009778 [Cadophora sp. M221]|nr:hypothetical protein IFR05_009778 [Cadophora sp. M221]